MISISSTDQFSGENTGTVLFSIFHFLFPSLTEEEFLPIHYSIRKLAHFTEYAILSLLLLRAFRSGAILHWRWSWATYTFLIVIACAFLDEYHQTFTQHRTGSAYDSLIDIAGGLTALVLVRICRKYRES